MANTITHISNMRRLHSLPEALIFASICLGFAAWINSWIVPAEDAVILYEYSKNLAQHGVITYGGSLAPVEGATDFLWMVVLALLMKTGFPAFASALFLTMMAAYGLTRLVFGEELRAVAIGALALLVTPFFWSGLAGFSTIVFSFTYCIFLLCRTGRSSVFYSLALILCLLRPDGVAWVTGPIVAQLVQGRNAMSRNGAQLLLYFVLPGLIYFIWRWQYFGQLLPLPFYVKSAGARDLFLFQYNSLVAISLVLIPAAATLLASGRRRLLAKDMALCFAIPALFYATMNLEQNVGNRFCAPFFFGFLFLARDEDLHKRLAFIFLVCALNIKFTGSAAFNDVLDSRNQRIYTLSRDLAKVGQGKMLTTEAGRLAYYSGWIVEDSWGLNTPRYARTVPMPQELLMQHYDVIAAHCNIEKFNAPITISEQPSATKTRDSLCRNIAISVADGFDIFLVPFYSGARLGDWVKANIGYASRKECSRYDIYAVRKESGIHDQVAYVLQENKAIRLDDIESERATIHDDLLCL